METTQHQRATQNNTVLKNKDEIINSINSINEKVNELLVINPKSNGGRTKNILKKISDRKNIFVSEHQGHITDFLRNLKTVPSKITIYGGDGTLHEVINGLATHYPIAPILKLVGMGTGNSLYRELKRLRQKRVFCDVVKLSLLDVENKLHEKYVIACAGLGHIAYVAGKANQHFKFLNKKIVYPVSGMLFTLFKWGKVANFNLSIQSNHNRATEQIRNISNIIVSNCSFTGNYQFSPGSDLGDGEIEFIFNKNFNGFQLLDYSFKVLMKQKYQSKNAEIVEKKYKDVSITVDRPIPVHLDGEVMEGIVQINFSVINRKFIFEV